MHLVNQSPLDGSVGVEKKEVFERYLTSRRRAARMSAVQVMYLHDFNTKMKEMGVEDEDLFEKQSSVDTKISNLCHAVLYFYKNVFPAKEEYSLQHKNKRMDEKSLHDIVSHSIKNLDKIDKIISMYLNERWTVEKLDVVVRAILRCAVAELLFNTKTDIPILTSEYTNLASNFFSGKEIGFVNGVVDKIGKAVRSRINN